ncbi:MAG: formimidoylglutamate deiminase [Burkholderiales bacterium]|nr:formimidoylglutamate deiminase [Burkholderiales bacterium]
MFRRLHAPVAMLPDAWASDVLVEIDDGGVIASVTPGVPRGEAEDAGGPLVPGMPNLHSHAFQRAMAGLAERMGSPEDSFWTWREVMYRFLARLDPDDCHAIASQLYVEMLREGYTAVAEFHYLHRDPAGRRYADPAEMSLAHVRAAREAGIAITHLASLYAHGGFGGAPLAPGQRRFATAPADVLEIVRRVRAEHRADPDVRAGVAPHSLRAVSPPLLAELLDGLAEAAPTAPVHIHAAEQVKEVEDCLAWSGRRPVEWLLDNAPVDERWCLVHCTHMTREETRRLAASGAVAGLCPTTEGNLGDGIFPFPAFFAADGHFGIGGDSHVSRSPVEELRWLEYVQRLQHRRRNLAASPARPSVGATLWRRALDGGCRALARPAGAIAPGARADLVVLDGEHPDLEGRRDDAILDTLVFSGSERLVRHVAVSGRWVIRDRRHEREHAIADRYRRAVAKLLADAG